MPYFFRPVASKHRSAPAVRLALLAFMLLACARTAVQAAVTPEIQRAVRAAAFEVVLKKPEKDPLSYEKPLPFELLPYIERTDLYRSIGTAFALGGNRYVTAGHVLVAAIDSQYGEPSLRAPDGKVYAIREVLKFSAHEDFVVFSLVNDPAPVALGANRTPQVDTPVLAVGNALGEGVVVRDGLFTSQTAEEQDGRWKWIRFSAAASPGNSGGPLLDSTGNVIGVVVAKSPNENLNYALPIANVLDAPDARASFEQRSLSSLPYMNGTRTFTLQDGFTLPLAWPAFVKSFQAVQARRADQAREQLLAAYAATLFPNGSGTESVLYDVPLGANELGMVVQQADNSWQIERPSFDDTDLPGDGVLSLGAVAGVKLLRLRRSNEAADAAFFKDSKAFMDIALKGLGVRRQVGTDSVRVTSLGPALSDSLQPDRYGRKWQLRVWPLPYLDFYVVAMQLPTPDGYVALIQYAPSSALREVKNWMSLLAAQVTTSYRGTLPQWQAFLGRRELLPASLADVTLSPGPEWRLHTHRFDMSVPAPIMKLDAHSRLLLNMAYMYNGSAVTWDLGGAWWYRDAQEKAYIGLWRQARPPSTAKQELRNAFQDLMQRNSPYDGLPVRSGADLTEVHCAVQSAGSKPGTASGNVAYALSLYLDGHVAPGQMGGFQELALKSMAIIEHGGGADIPAAAPANLSSVFDQYMNQLTDKTVEIDKEAGRDIRGRLFSQDVEEYLIGFARTVLGFHSDGTPASGSSTDATATDPKALEAEGMRRANALQAYWNIAPGLVHNRDLWAPFLAYNHLPAATAHSDDVRNAEARLNAAFSETSPGIDWQQRAQDLDYAYINERHRLVGTSQLAADAVYRNRQSACPAPAAATSGKEKPAINPVTSSLSAYYPDNIRRNMIEGAVVLSIKVNNAGCPTAFAIVGSSGLDALDEAALRWIENASYRPAEHLGKAVEATTRLLVNFQLHGQD